MNELGTEGGQTDTRDMPSAEREGGVVVTEEALELCAQEPIHIPGAIQPHGLLMTVDEPGLVVTRVSANTTAWLAARPEEVLGQPLAQALGESAAAQVRWALDQPSLADVNPLHLEVHGRAFDGIAHRHAGVTVLELEPTPDETGRTLSRERLLGRVVTRLHAARSVDDLLERAVDEIRCLTGFDRVLAYRFDEDGHGEVVAESRDPEVPTFFGHHFPASDIPRQARELYRLNWLRLIPEVTYEPVPLLAAPQTPDDPLDLSLSVLRSVSPIHREYMRNMGVCASLSISLLPEQELWGLITCHHREARFVPYEVRAACELAGRLASLQLAALDELDQRHHREGLRASLDRLKAAMRDTDGDPLAGLAGEPEALLDLVGAGGAAVIADERIRLVGNTPTETEVRALIEWLRTRRAPDVFYTRDLSAVYPPARRYAAVASGIMTISLPRPTPPHVLWFRPEVVQTMNWAGNPNKAVERGPDGMRLHPRRSFEAWKEVVQARSLAWRRVEAAAAEDLRKLAIELDLERQVRREQAATRARDDLVAVVSHDLRNPLGVIQMQAAVLQRTLASEDAESSRKLRAAADRIQQAIGRMGQLINDLLDLAKIEAGRVELAPRPIEVSALIGDAIGLLLPLVSQKGLRLEMRLDQGLRVNADPDRIFQVLSNLIGNAIKFTPEPGAIELTARQAGAFVEMSVRDSGPGIDPADLPRVFDRYWRAPRPQRAPATGSGLGLYIARGIVEAHGGRIWVESTPGAGAVFTFTLPALP